MAAALAVFGAAAASAPSLAGEPARAIRRTGTVLVSETFTRATADPRFRAFGAACLTGAPRGGVPAPGLHPLQGCRSDLEGPVPPGSAAPFGYLQLTDAHNDQVGAVLFDPPIPSAQGLEVTFEQWQYGNTSAVPADGISFFLTDGSVELTEPGAFGGSLGYAQKLPDDDPDNPFLPGAAGGYLGIGLDVLGNYFGDWERRGNGCERRSPAGTIFRIPAPGPNMVTVRGPGDDTVGYCFLAATTSNLSTTPPWPSTLPGQLQGTPTSIPPGTTPEQAQALLEPSKRTVRVRITPAPDPVVTVDVDFNDGAGFRQVLSFPAPEPVPDAYSFGFAASTGLFTDVHLIRNLTISSILPIPSPTATPTATVSPSRTASPTPPAPVPPATQEDAATTSTRTATSQRDDTLVTKKAMNVSIDGAANHQAGENFAPIIVTGGTHTGDAVQKGRAVHRTPIRTRHAHTAAAHGKDRDRITHRRPRERLR
ncbi:lectin-like domain-containing protein [Microbispora sp. ATCC PTA-5024]|uniref:lectin-like domain-containing protein n=1 Tax=Microbispora sp. ATCC PTA-5024 TaxID=316330 RepID=UPI0003DB7CE3|nr:hypothetical protein [Microbispora sp. ATCC PTA-5024]ETK31430.1 hypothetical protein MPTA5024_35250 [Microbispora sp. ATCC PTA-5024]